MFVVPSFVPRLRSSSCCAHTMETGQAGPSAQHNSYRSSSYPTASPPGNQQLRGDQHSEPKRPLDPRRRLFRPTLEARGAICARRAASAPEDTRLVPTPTRTRRRFLPSGIRESGAPQAPASRAAWGWSKGGEFGKLVNTQAPPPLPASPAAAPSRRPQPAQLETKARRRPRRLRPEKLQRRARLYLGTPTPGPPAALSSPAASLLALLGPSPEARALPG